MESYEFVNGRSSANPTKEESPVEDIGAVVDDDADEGEGHEDNQDISNGDGDVNDNQGEDVADDSVEHEDILLEDKEVSDSEDTHPDLRKRSKKSDN